MKSVQVFNVVPNGVERDRYSDLQVMQSAAGYYIGTHYNAVEGWIEPGSRDSPYYQTKERAEYAFQYLLNLYNLCKDELCPEDIANKWARQMYTFGYDPQQVGYKFWP